MKIPKEIENLMNSKEYANELLPKSEDVRQIVNEYFETTYLKNENLIPLMIWKNSDKKLKNVKTKFVQIEDSGKKNNNDIFLNPLDVLKMLKKENKDEQKKEPVVCELCENLDNQVFKDKKDMEQKGIKCPAHPNCNCRLVNILVDKDFAQQLLDGEITLKDLIEMTDEDTAYKNIMEFEGVKEFGYADTNGNITIGAGKLVKKEQDFIKLDLYKKDGKLASENEKSDEFNRIINKRDKMKAKDIKNNVKENLLKSYNYKAEIYKDNENGLIYKQENIKNDMKEYLQNSIKDLKKISNKKEIEFEKLTDNQKTVLLDMIYNMGAEKVKEKYKEFWKALKNNDIREAAKQTSSTGISNKRNQWRYDTFLKN